jgi:DNA-binding MarR family transcriptional regulator
VRPRAPELLVARHDLEGGLLAHGELLSAIHALTATRMARIGRGGQPAAGSRERPDLDVAALALLARLFRTVHLADAVLAEQLAAYGLQPGWFDVLAALRRAGEPYALTPTQLLRTMMLSSGGMTKRLDRLADAGLIERGPDPNDRRGTLVKLTSRGKATIDTLLPIHLSNEQQLLAPLSPAQQRTLDQLLRLLLTGLEQPQ